MSITNFEAAQLLWQAREEMDAAADDMRAAQQTTASAEADMTWQSVAARMFHERVTELTDTAGYAAVECAEEARILLERGNAAVLS